MTVSLPDARQLSDKEPEVLCLRTLRDCRLRYMETELEQLLGASRETVCYWWSACADAGLIAIHHDRTGRPLRSDRWLDEHHAQQIQGIMDEHVSEELRIAAPLWTRRGPGVDPTVVCPTHAAADGGGKCSAGAMIHSFAH